MTGPIVRNLALSVPAIRRLVEQRDALIRRNAELEPRAAERDDLVRRNAELEARLAARGVESGEASGTGTNPGQEEIVTTAVQRALAAVRAEYTSLPRFAFHLPMDFEDWTAPPRFDPPIRVEGEELPLPPTEERHGHATSDQEYLEWGKYDRDVIFGFARQFLPSTQNLSVMDFGCSSGRILRHFYPETKLQGWKLTGVDVSARKIEWLRRNFPKGIQVYTGSFLPILPFESNSFDMIFGMSVFTHMKFLWDLWLLELRRVLKPGGILVQSIHTEYAWNFFSQHSHEDWARDSLGPLLVEFKTMPDDFVYYGNLDKNQVFWKKDIALEFWGRYFSDVRHFPPPERYSYQDWLVATK